MIGEQRIELSVGEEMRNDRCTRFMIAGDPLVVSMSQRTCDAPLPVGPLVHLHQTTERQGKILKTDAKVEPRQDWITQVVSPVTGRTVRSRILSGLRRSFNAGHRIE